MKTLLIAAALLIAPVAADAAVLSAEVAAPPLELVVRAELRGAIVALSKLAPLVAVLTGGVAAVGLALALTAAGRTPAQTPQTPGGLRRPPTL